MFVDSVSMPEGFPLDNGEIYLLNSNGASDEEKVSL